MAACVSDACRVDLESRSIIVLVEHSNQHHRFSGQYILAMVSGHHHQLVLYLLLVVQTSLHHHTATFGVDGEKVSVQQARLPGEFEGYQSVIAVVCIGRFHSQEGHVASDPFRHALLIRLVEEARSVVV